MFDEIKRPRAEEPPVFGFEYCVDWLLLVLRHFSLSYLARRPFEHPRRTGPRSRVIDLYCISQLAVLAILLAWCRSWLVSTLITGYVLFEVYLTLFNIVFIGKFRSINYPPSSVERVVLLMFLNVLQVVTAFAVLYHTWSPSWLSGTNALSKAIRVLGTVEAPPNLRFLVDLQIVLDLLLLVIFLACFVGQVGVFRNSSDQGSKSQTTGAEG